MINFTEKSRDSYIYPDAPVLVILDKTGVHHKNQVDGISCLQRTCIGYGYPLSFMSIQEQDSISECICRTNNIGFYKDSLKRILKKYSLDITVDDFIMEGWIPMKIKIGEEIKNAVLMYNNCD